MSTNTIKSLFKSNFVIIILFVLNQIAVAQKQDRIWLFPDSAGIDFTDSLNPVAINCNLTIPAFNSASISNNQGNLLFYTGGIDLTYTPMRIFDRNGNIMMNADSMKGYPWVGQGNMIIPSPSDTNKYFVFMIDRDGALGDLLYYSILDISLNNGLGQVLIRDSLLLPDHINEKLNATKHANGRDWWVIVQSTNTDSLFHKFLITPNGITGPFDQKIGSADNVNKAFGQLIFSRDGSKLGLVGGNSTADIFDFDRCSGELSNYIMAGEGIFSNPNFYFGCSFSPNGKVFYTSSIWYEFKNVYQYDLTATDIKASKQTIFAYPDTGIIQDLEMGEHLLGPDNKIYISKGNGYTGHNWDTYYTHHIDVILNPDSLGFGCNYQSAYFDLGTGKTMEMFPNMVNYNLGPLTGSICDSLSSGIPEIDNAKYFKIFPNPFSKDISISLLNDEKGSLAVYNQMGQIVYRNTFRTNAKIDLSNLPSGFYFFEIGINGRRFMQKMIKVSE